MVKIDLHGLTHEKAVLKVEHNLILNQLCKYGSIEIITGKSPELQEKIIKEVLDVHKFSYYIPPHNTGMMYVSDDELL
jgi:DNA-nicking Smr family endonuclease